MKKLTSIQELETLRNSLNQKRDTGLPTISVCGGTGCSAQGSDEMREAFKSLIKEKGIKANLLFTGCHGFCENGPLVVIGPKKVFYNQVKAEDVPEIVEKTLLKGQLVERLLYVDPATKKRVEYEGDVPFYQKQQRLIFGLNGKIDPAKIEDYIAAGGYKALEKALSRMTPREIVEEVKKSGIRGRGGAGFPTGLKWEATRKAHGDLKYIIANCDEGDPGAFMDRSLMEGNPHSVIEGIILAGYAIGAREGYIYIRNEYPLAVKNTLIALAQAEELGLLGEKILGSDFSLSIIVNRGGGAFICGESTALMASLEGKAGEPRAKYIHTSERGLYDRPSNLNNVETLANIPHIVNNGSKWFSSVGTEGSKGTKIFSLVGKIKNTGLIEVPMGITLREIIYDIGGGIKDNKKFKAVQTGGPSGGCLPESLLNLKVDFDELARAGSMMGSGGMIIMDEKNCMVDVARYFLGFLAEESCGKCVPCREGIKRLLGIVTKITEGKGEMGDLDLLERLGSAVCDASLCGLGQTAPNPVLSTLKYFRDEYVAHIKDKKCLAGVCKPLIHYYIKDNCPGCGLCVKGCPVQAITLHGKKKPATLDQDLCTKCGACFDTCKLNAVEVR